LSPGFDKQIGDYKKLQSRECSLKISLEHLPGGINDDSQNIGYEK
jgi:hypothetical protein